MLSYRDMTFCAAQDCGIDDCHRNPNYAINWEDVRRTGLGVAYAEFQHSCRWYEPVERKNVQDEFEEELPMDETSNTIYGVTHW